MGQTHILGYEGNSSERKIQESTFISVFKEEAIPLFNIEDGRKIDSAWTFLFDRIPTRRNGNFSFL
jgi:hypothetical protein